MIDIGGHYENQALFPTEPVQSGMKMKYLKIFIQ